MDRERPPISVRQRGGASGCRAQTNLGIGGPNGSYTPISEAFGSFQSLVIRTISGTCVKQISDSFDDHRSLRAIRSFDLQDDVVMLTLSLAPNVQGLSSRATSPLGLLRSVTEGVAPKSQGQLLWNGVTRRGAHLSP